MLAPVNTTIEQKPLPVDVPEQPALEDVIEAVMRDSQNHAQKYLDETRVPYGGE